MTLRYEAKDNSILETLYDKGSPSLVNYLHFIDITFMIANLRFLSKHVQWGNYYFYLNMCSGVTIISI